jgi:hypothetical protein
LEGRRDFRLDVLAADVDGDRRVTAADFQANVARQFSAAGDAGYDVRHDVNADGVINISDWKEIRDQTGNGLIQPAPGAILASEAASRAVLSAVRLRKDSRAIVSKHAVDEQPHWYEPQDILSSK